ncbi:energy transducer TonB family protein [Sphingobium mellinum]|uniref:energy transducer TonB family protein n=1 Tax=Sphingobium mellinum TaxID=1387166 RepID=UPI0030EB6E9A
MYAKPVIVALCACLISPGAAIARAGGGQLTVVAPEKSQISYSKWTDRAASRLSRGIRNASALYGDRASTGYARVQFRLNDQGRPADVDLAGPSTSSDINRLSLRAIRSMGSLYPLPQEVRAGSRFEAWIVVANDAAEKESMLTVLRAEHRARTMAVAATDQPVLIAMR